MTKTADQKTGYFQKNIAKLLILTCVVMMASLFAFKTVHIAQAASCDGVDYFKNIGECVFQNNGVSGTSSTSFVEFRGGLTAPSTEGFDPALTQVTSAREFVLKVVNFALGFLGLIAVVIIIYGGFRYVLSAGESGGTETGKKAIMYAVIGIVIIAASFAIVNTALKIPSGTDRDTAGPQNAVFATAPGASAGTYGNQMYTIVQSTLTTYGSYAQMKFKLDDIENKIKNAFDETGFIKFNGYDDATSALALMGTKFGQIRDALDQITNQFPSFPELKSYITAFDNANKSWIREMKIKIDQASKEKATAESLKSFYDSFKKDWGDYNTKLIAQDGAFGKLRTAIENAIYKNIDDLEQYIGVIKEKVSPLLSPEMLATFDKVDFQSLKQNKDDPEKAKQNLGTIAGALETLYTNLKDLKSVAVKLTADKYKGNAPLIVNFSTIGTRDPAEESTKAGGKKQIEWKFLASADAQCADNGATANCLFKKAGSYKIGVIVSSIDPQTVVPGTAYVTIDVLPSTGKINLKVTTKSIDADIIQYDEEGNLTANRDSLSVPAKEAVDGVRFDASQTKDATQFKWNFGGAQGEVIGKPGDKDIVTMPFTREGKYRIVLEVTTKDGNVSRKVFDLVVSSVSAFISVNPGSTVRAGLKVDFNCVTGRNQGRIDTKWSAQSDSPKADTSKFDTTDQRFALTLEDPAIYKVQCEVKNEQGDTATDELALRVESNPPVARFLAMAGRKNQPSDFTLDASYSYDPDGLNQNIVYTWGLSGEEGKQYKIIEGDKNSEKVLVRFLQKGEYKIQLEAKDANEGKGTKADALIRVENLLDIDWSESNPVSLKLDNNQQAEAKITILSEQGKNYQIEYGDGEIDSGIFENKKATVTHIYHSARPFMVKVTAYDEDSNENSVTRKIIVGGSDKPLAVARIKMNGELVNTSEMFVVTRKTNLTFDASDSQNTDGSGKNLTYLWDFGNGVKSTKKTTSYIYKDKSPQNPGYFQVKLTVTDDQDSKKTDTDDSVKILVANQKPTLKSLVVIPQGSELRTPITVQVKAFEPRDPDGSIVSYRWWYYDVKNPNIELSTKVTTTPSVLFNIGTRGQEGDLMEYGFNMEMRDDENQVSRASDLLKTQSPPSFTIINGPNKAPVAKFSVSKTNVKVKEAVTFTSVSADPDGTIIGYVWDTEGDGFDNNEQTDKSSIVVNYEQAKTKGIQVRLRVIDNNFGEAVSDPVTIFIMPNGNPPIANFSFASGAGDNKIAFKDATKILDTTKNTTVVSYKWDFDADTDSDNNGVRDDDNESSEKNPIHQYKSSGVYNVKLTVTDNEGAQGVITNIVNVSAAPKTGGGIVAKGALSPTTGSSVGAFSAAPESLLAQMKTTPDASLIDGKIHLKGVAGNVTFDYSSSKGNIVRYEIDKNIYFDGDGDGINDNDKDYTDTKPGSWTTDYQSAWGKVATKLTIYDAAGNKKSTIREITFLGELGGGGNNIFVLPGETSLYGALASMFGFGILKSRRKKRIIKKQT